MSATITFTLDGRELTAAKGQTLIEAADAGGVYIPSLCWMKELIPAGSCRVCTVLVNGRPQSACTHPAVDGAVVHSETPELLEWRRSIVEMLFVEGNHYCMSCEKSGNCRLQALAYRLGIAAPRFPYLFPKRAVDASHPDVLLDLDRCILCGLCIRASRQLDHKAVFGAVSRGPCTRIAPNGEDLGDTDLKATDRAVHVCPVGAILPKRVGFAVPVGERLYDHRPIGSDIEDRTTA